MRHQKVKTRLKNLFSLVLTLIISRRNCTAADFRIVPADTGHFRDHNRFDVHIRYVPVQTVERRADKPDASDAVIGLSQAKTTKKLIFFD